MRPTSSFRLRPPLLAALLACAGFRQPALQPQPPSPAPRNRRRRHDDRMGGQEPLPAVPPRVRFPAPCHRQPRRQPARRRAPARARHRRARLGAEHGRPAVRQRSRRAGWTPATATASAKTIWRRRPIRSSRGWPARCRPARPATGASTTAPSRRKQVNAPAPQPVHQRLAYGKPTIAAVGITRPDNSVDSVSTEIEVRDLLIAGLGNSVAAGEGNPDRPIALADEGFCFRRFLGARARRIFPAEPARLQGRQGLRRQPGRLADLGRRLEQPRRPLDVGGLPPFAVRLSASHRAGARGREPAHRRHLPAARLQRRHDRERPVRLAGRQRLPARPDAAPARCRRRSSSCRTCSTRPASSCRAASSTSSCSRSAPTTSNSPASSPTSSSAPASSARCSTRAASSRRCRRRRAILDRELPQQLRQAPQRAQAAGRRQPVARRLCLLRPSGDGTATRPAPADATASTSIRRSPPTATRLKNVTDFVLNEFLPTREGAGALRGRAEVRQSRHRPHDLRRCPSGGVRQSRHLRALAAGSGVRPRMLLGRRQRASSPIRWRRANSPLVCSLRPSDFRPYAPRARWIRTANDSYFTAMTYPRGLSSTMQPSDIHDATWGAMSAVYGGAFHPSAEGHAAMADAALPAVARCAWPQRRRPR